MTEPLGYKAPVKVFEETDYIQYLLTRNFSSRAEDKLPQQLLQFLVKFREIQGDSSFQLLSQKAKEVRKERKQYSESQLKEIRAVEEQRYSLLGSRICQYVDSKTSKDQPITELQKILDFTGEFMEFQSNFQVVQSDAPEVYLREPEEVETMRRKLQMIELENQRLKMQIRETAGGMSNNQNMDQQKLIDENVSLLKQIAQYKNEEGETLKLKQSMHEQVESHQQQLNVYKSDLEQERNNAITVRKELQQLNRRIENYQKFALSLSKLLNQRTDGEPDLTKLYQQLSQLAKVNANRIQALASASNELKGIRMEFMAIRQDLQGKQITQQLDGVGIIYLQQHKRLSIKATLAPSSQEYNQPLPEKELLCLSKLRAQSIGAKYIENLPQELARLGQQLKKAVLRGKSSLFIDCTQYCIQSCINLLKQITIGDSDCYVSCIRTDQKVLYDGIRNEKLNQEKTNNVRIQVQNEAEYLKVLNLLQRKLSTDFDEFSVQVEAHNATAIYKLVSKPYWDVVMENADDGVIICE